MKKVILLTMFFVLAASAFSFGQIIVVQSSPAQTEISASQNNDGDIIDPIDDGENDDDNQELVIKKRDGN